MIDHGMKVKYSWGVNKNQNHQTDIQYHGNGIYVHIYRVYWYTGQIKVAPFYNVFTPWSLHKAYSPGWQLYMINIVPCPASEGITGAGLHA